MQRRSFLTKSSALSAAVLAGCTGDNTTTNSDEDDIQDSDGDGVIDSEDYAPQDPDVQEKSDLQNATSTAPSTTTTTTTTPTPTQTVSSTTDTTTTAEPTTVATTTAEPTTETWSSANSIQVDASEFPETVSHILEYSSTKVRVRVHPEGPSVTETGDRSLWVIAADYVGDNIYAAGHTAVDLSGSAIEAVVDVEWESKPEREPLLYGAILGPADAAYEDLSGSNTDYLRETDAFEIQRDSRSIENTSISEIEDLDDDEGERHERTKREGEFSLSFNGRTNGESWDVSFIIYKSAYVEAVRRDHGRRRSQFVSYEMANGFAGEIATILSEEAEENEFTGKREKVDFIIDFVQYLPYVPDDVSTDFDDYTKYCAETLVELGGDCEDSAILLASVLQSEPFGYDMVLIQPPEHMAAGIYGEEDLGGYYWEDEERKYYYIETTGVGWEIGDLPDEYKNETAYVHQV